MGGTKVKRLVLGVLAVEVAILTVTGIYLFFAYRPSTARLLTGTSLADHARVVHRWAAAVTVFPTSMVALVVLLAEAGQRWQGEVRRRTGAVAGPLILAGAAVASFSGFLLPWDQIGLWAVTVGTSIHGYETFWQQSYRFVIIGGAEVPIGTLQRWTVVHVLVSVVLAGAVAASWGRGRKRQEVVIAATEPEGAPLEA